MRKALFLVSILGLVAAVSLQSALGATRATEAADAAPGVSRTTINLGGTFPLTGPASLYAPIPRGMDAYFKWVNQRRGPDGRRGIYGRRINWKFYDDEYNPAKTVQFTNQLVLQDRVFAIVGSLGTEPNIPIRPILNQRKVPHILVSTGASYWGLQYGRFPWTIGWQPDYIAEGIAYGRWIARNAPNSRIAVFFQNDDYGNDYKKGLRIGLGSRTSLIVSEQGYEITDTSYGSQMTRLRASGADTLVLLTTPTPTVRAIATARALNFRPTTIVINSVAAVDSVMRAAAQNAGADFVNGAISSAYLKNPTNPQYANDPQVRQFLNLWSRFGQDGVQPNTFHYYGMAKAYDTVRLLYAAGRNPTRQSLMNATKRMNWVNPFAIRGVRVRTGQRDRFPISQMKLIRYNNGTWSEFGGLLNGR